MCNLIIIIIIIISCDVTRCYGDKYSCFGLSSDTSIRLFDTRLNIILIGVYLFLLMNG